MTGRGGAAAESVVPVVVRRLGGLSLWWHAAALTALLAVLVPFIGTDVSAFSREGAILLQARTLAEEGTWTVEHPLPEVDPEGVAFPVDGAAWVDAEGDGWVPITGRPAYSATLARLWSFGGPTVPIAVSVLGTVAAALAAAFLTRRVAPGLDVLALWVSGVGTSLFFETYTVYSHTLAAACCGFACLAAFDRARSTSLPRAIVAAALLGVSVLLLRPAAFFAVLVVVVLAVQAVRHRARAYAVVAGTVLVSTVVAGFGDWWWYRSVVPAGSPRQVIGVGPDHPVFGRLDAAFITWLEPGVAMDPTGPILLGLAFLIGAYAVLVARRADPDRIGRFEFAAFGAALLAWIAVLAVFASSSHILIRGFAVATPVLGLGVFAATRLEGQAGELAAVAAGFVTVFVVASYEPGVLTEWGARSLVVVVPVLVPATLIWWHHIGRRLPLDVRGLAVWSLVVGTLAVTVLAVHTLRFGHERMRDLQELSARIGSDSDPGDGGPPIVVALSHTAGSASWSVWDEQRWLSVADEHLVDIVGRLEDIGVNSVVVLSQRSAADELVGLDAEVVEYDDERGVLLVLEQR